MKPKQREVTSKSLIWLGLGLGLPIWVHGIMDVLRYPYGLKGIIASAREATMHEGLLTEMQAVGLYLAFALVPVTLLVMGLYLRHKEKRLNEGNGCSS